MALLELRILKIHSFPHFSLSCFDILSSNFAYDFVSPYHRSSSSVVNLRQFVLELCAFWNLEYWKYTVCRQIALMFVGVMALLELRILKIHSFPHFSLSCLGILSSNFAYDFVSPYHRSSSSVVNLHQFLLELCPFWNLEYWKYTVFRTFLLYA